MNSAQPKQTYLSSTRIPSLDGLRAISIALVMLAHMSETHGFPFPPYGHKLSVLGVLGVRIFFVISGFLITTLLLEEEGRNGRISIPGFYLRRAFRIWPVAYTYILVVALLSALGYIALPPHNLLFAATFTMNHVGNGIWWTGHLWSLSLEEQFYLVWPIMFLVSGMRGRLISCWLVLGIAPVLRAAAYIYAPAVYSSMQMSLLFLGDAIAVGCLLALLRPQLERSATVKRVMAWPGFFLAPVLSFVIYVSVVGRIWKSLFAIGDSISLLLLAVAVWGAVHSNNWAIRILNSRSLVSIGQHSYSLYIWQELFLNRASPFWVSAFPQNVLAAILAAVLSYRFIEVPFLRLRSRVLAWSPRRRLAEPLARQSESDAAVPVGEG